MALAFVIFCLGCQDPDPHTPQSLLLVLKKSCASRDAGLLMNSVDVNYQDNLGGPGRLEDDVRQLFRVYGQLLFKFQDVTTKQKLIKGHAIVEGKGLRYEGPLQMSTTSQPDGLFLSSGVLTDLRSIVYSLRERRLALESGIVERLQRLISQSYSGPGGGRQELIDRLRKDLEAVKAQALMVDDVNIMVSGDQARVIQSFLLITRVGERKLENRDRERLHLRREGHWWYFVGGLG
jgi:hypothetical protein